jgi:hypothetical protein
MLHENDVVRLKHDVPMGYPTAWPGAPSTPLIAGDLGTIVMVYTNDSIHYEYEVEFLGEIGMTRGFVNANPHLTHFANLKVTHPFHCFPPSPSRRNGL